MGSSRASGWWRRAAASGRPWTKRPGHHRHPSWAPDGRIFFESGEEDQRGIYVAPSFDSERAMLVVPGGREPAVSWDGRKLAFVSTGTSGYQRISVTSVDDWSKVTALTTDRDGRWDHVDPAWSSDGRWICYRANDGLWLVPSDRSESPVPLTKGTVDAHPAWSASGFVYFSSLREGIWQLWRVRPNERPAERVTSGIGIEQMPSLSRDGRVLAFSTRRRSRGRLHPRFEVRGRAPHRRRQPEAVSGVRAGRQVAVPAAERVEQAEPVGAADCRRRTVGPDAAAAGGCRPAAWSGRALAARRVA